MTERIPQKTSELFHPIPSIDKKGTLNPDASAPTNVIETEYIPVMTPTFKGNFILINPGNNTFPKAMAIPMMIVPPNKNAVPSIERMIIPHVKRSKEMKIVLSIPIRFAILGANGDRSANASNGNVVIIPTIPLFNPKSSRINEINEPTDVNGARRLAAIKMIPSNKSHVFPCLVVCSEDVDI